MRDKYSTWRDRLSVRRETCGCAVRSAATGAECAQDLRALVTGSHRIRFAMEPLQVEVVYFYPRENADPHHTNKFEAVNEETPTATIVRRGQTFSGVVRFVNRQYDAGNDLVQFLFTLGDNPRHDTQGAFFLQADATHDAHAWSGRILSSDGDTISFQISTPVTAPVGSWALRVVTRLKDAPVRAVYDFEEEFYLLFNPWNKDDQTYMEESQLLEEYVLNDVGKVWVGPIKSCRGRHWFYGQFDKVVLPACMFIMDRAEIPFEQRGDPVKLTRAISRIVNSNDDQGVLIGRWDGEYADGTAPAAWTGSVDILLQYLESQQEVAYGQCWVFAGVVTTVCRALGIPSRVVSNLVSAHDANGTLTVDKYYTETMEEMDSDPNNPKGGADSIWNYHVWNDVWMSRPDLPNGYGGWQAIDATPQEQSNGMFQCGPASLEAIKQGQLGLSYDVDFMLASVNADLMRWRVCSESPDGYAMVDSNKYTIGRNVFTKKPYVFDPVGDADREDITHLYKHNEGTASERAALYNGARHSERAKRYYAIQENKQSDIEFRMREIDTIGIGHPFKVIVDIENKSAEGRNIKAVLTATSVFYNGVKAGLVKKAEGKIFVAPTRTEQLVLNVEADDYVEKLVEYCNMKISAMCMVDETKQSWADDDDFQVIKPTITIKFNDDLLLKQPTVASLSFTNPLNKTLTSCQFQLSGAGIVGRTLRAPHADVPPHSLVSTEIPVEPTKAGKLNLVATFTSTELRDITGAVSADVFEE